jgi:hypothetical protein
MDGSDAYQAEFLALDIFDPVNMEAKLLVVKNLFEAVTFHP